MKAESGRSLFSEANATRSDSPVFKWYNRRKRRRILACGASSGRDVNVGVGDRDGLEIDSSPRPVY